MKFSLLMKFGQEMVLIWLGGFAVLAGKVAESAANGALQPFDQIKRLVARKNTEKRVSAYKPIRLISKFWADAALAYKRHAHIALTKSAASCVISHLMRDPAFLGITVSRRLAPHQVRGDEIDNGHTNTRRSLWSKSTKFQCIDELQGLTFATSVLLA